MIDWSAVHRNGLVVTCKNEDESLAFWRDISDIFYEYDVEETYGWVGQRHHILYRHRSYADGCVSYDIIVRDGGFAISWCNEEYYRDTAHYKYYEFVDYSVGNCSQFDLGELEVEDAADVSLLFLNEVPA